MSRKKKQKGKKLILMTGMFIIVICIAILYFIRYSTSTRDNMKEIFNKVEPNRAMLTEYIVYGTHLNIKGTIDCDTSSIDSVNLTFEKLDGQKDKVKLKYEIGDGGITFYTSDLINEGINLEGFTKNKYYMLIEVKQDKKDTYYSIENKTEYDTIDYYTITRNNSNYKEEIRFGTYETEMENINYMMIDVKNARLPKEVYDIVIDPGHGGLDNGAEYKGYSESDLTLEYGKEIKAKLEKLGLKVKITRDGTENEETFGAQTVYDSDGRVNIVRKV